MFIVIKEEQPDVSTKALPEMFEVEGVCETEDEAIIICRTQNAPEVNEKLPQMDLATI